MIKLSKIELRKIILLKYIYINLGIFYCFVKLIFYNNIIALCNHILRGDIVWGVKKEMDIVYSGSNYSYISG